MKIPLRVTVNGVPREDLVEARTSLLTYLREQCDLTGTKRACEEGECGCCSVLLDGTQVTSCLVFAIEAQGKDVVTVEGLSEPLVLGSLQEAFAENGASQCGFCIPGMLMSATSLLERNGNPSEAEIRRAISGNLCRCTGYDRIVAAIAQAAERRRGAKG